MKSNIQAQNTLVSLLPKGKSVEALSSQEILELFLDVYRKFMLFKISLDEFSTICGILRSQTEKGPASKDILYAELKEVFYAGSELGWASRSSIENYPSFMEEITSFVSLHKKTSKSKI